MPGIYLPTRTLVCSEASLLLIVDCPARGEGFLRRDGRRCSVAMEDSGSAGKCARVPDQRPQLRPATFSFVG
jgi:hypothetical protein